MGQRYRYGFSAASSTCSGLPSSAATSPAAAIEQAAPTSPWQPISAPDSEAYFLGKVASVNSLNLLREAAAQQVDGSRQSGLGAMETAGQRRQCDLGAALRLISSQYVQKVNAGTRAFRFRQ